MSEVVGVGCEIHITQMYHVDVLMALLKELWKEIVCCCCVKRGVVYGRLATVVEGKSELLSVEQRVYGGAGYLGFWCVQSRRRWWLLCVCREYELGDAMCCLDEKDV